MSDLTAAETVEQIEAILEYVFQDKSLLVEAFTHSSAADDRRNSNERMEFLGDAVLAVVICQALFEKFPRLLEGDLTKMKSALVSRGSCAKVTRAMGLHSFLKVGKGMASSRSLPRSIVAGLLEGIIGAVYLDGGFAAAQTFILMAFGPMLEKTQVEDPQGNYKSMLQQHAQEKFGVTPVYSLLDEKGPDHNKCFETGVVVDERHFPSAWGITKKEAEQKAAFNALVELGVVEADSDDSDGDAA